VVLTKSRESFGRTALEALASGAALLSSGLGGLAEVCGPHAEVAHPADSEGLAVRLASLLDSPDLREKLAHAGRARVASLYDIGAVAKRMDDFIDEVLRPRDSGQRFKRAASVSPYRSSARRRAQRIEPDRQDA
jgi:glycosyltransferase involved in cell wall biosynthesis